MTASARDPHYRRHSRRLFRHLQAARRSRLHRQPRRGKRVITTDGRELIDFVLGSGPMVIGHAHPRVVAAVQEQAARGTTFYAMNDVAPRLAARIVELVPAPRR